jgi:hypothetical protein
MSVASKSGFGFGIRPLFFLQFVQVITQPVQLLLPALSVAIDERCSLGQRGCIQTQIVNTTLTPAFDKSRPFKALDVFGNDVKSARKTRGQLGHTKIFCGEQPQHFPAGGMRQRREDAVKTITIFTH